jgi:hypothetical protein
MLAHSGLGRRSQAIETTSDVAGLSQLRRVADASRRAFLLGSAEWWVGSLDWHRGAMQALLSLQQRLSCPGVISRRL